MTIALGIALALSALANLALFVQRVIWKGRAMQVVNVIEGTNRRLGTTFELLWKEAQAKGETDKGIFTKKVIALSECPEELRDLAMEKMGFMTPSKAQSKVGFQS